MNKVFFLIGFLLITVSCWAVTYNIGPGETYETFAAFHIAITPSPGDIVDGGNNTFTEQITLNASGNSTSVVTYQNFDINCGNATEHAISAVANTYLTFSNIEASNTTGTALFFYNTGHESDAKYITVNNCIVHDTHLNGIASTGSDITINNCTIYNMDADGIYARGINFTVTNCNIYNVARTIVGDCIQISTLGENCYIANNTLTNLNTLAKQCIVIGGDDTGGLVENNLCEITTEAGQSHFAIQVVQAGVIVKHNNFEGGSYCGNFLYSKVHHNIFKNASTVGVRIGGFEGDVTMYNNVIYNSHYGIYHDSNTTLSLYNNIIANNDTRGIHAADAIITNDYNCVYNNGTNFFGNNATKGTHSVETNPLFTDAANDDFTLKPGSPCINAGTNLGSSYDDALSEDSSWPSGILTIDQDIFQEWEIGAYAWPYGAGNKIW
ncbi:MAG: right-handed parallel beta-helix repeat-containing protein [Desulfobacteraceae bacterium]|nr:right-handed parallel beta-helix repeat-containing protein [Desulfobacteraceae bacterium]